GQGIEEAVQKTKRNLDKMADGDLPEQFFVLIECADEAEQLAMLRRFQKEGLRCQAKLTEQESGVRSQGSGVRGVTSKHRLATFKNQELPENLPSDSFP